MDPDLNFERWGGGGCGELFSNQKISLPVTVISCLFSSETGGNMM